MNPLLARALGAALLAAAAAGAQAADRTETRPVPAFTGISLSAPIAVEVVQGAQDSVVLEGEDRALAEIETVVENGSLRIRLKDRERRSWNLKARARVSARRIGTLAVSGSGELAARALQGDALTVSIAGSGDVRVEGRVGSLDTSIAGSGDLRAERLEARRVTVSIAGSGDATVWAREALGVRVAGSGDVGFYGDPTVARSVAGSGSVTRLGASPS